MLRKSLFLLTVFFLVHVGTLEAQMLITAREHFAEVDSAITAAHGNQVHLVQVISLYQVGPAAVTLDSESGTSEVWMYSYYSPEEDLMVVGLASTHPTIGMFVGEVGTDVWPEGGDTTAIDHRWVDSDAAAAVWNPNGMNAFLDGHPGARTEGIILARNPIAEEFVWVSLVTDGIDSLQCQVNAVTLDLIECGLTTDIDQLNTAEDFTLGKVYPNPVRHGSFTQLDINITEPTSLKVAVYDAQGRELGVVYDHQVDPQKLSLVIPSEFIQRSGFYFIHVTSSTGTVTKRFVVTR